METIKGAIKANILEFDLIEGGDLLNYDGPILSHYVDASNKHYLLWWADQDEKYMRWLLVNVTEDQLVSFFQKKTTLRNLFAENILNYIYIIDADKSVEIKRVYILQNKDIPETYLPTEKSYFDSKFYTSYANGFYKDLTGKSKPAYSDLSKSILEISNEVFAEGDDTIKDILKDISFEKSFKTIDESLFLDLFMFPLYCNYLFKYTETKDRQYIESSRELLKVYRNKDAHNIRVFVSHHHFDTKTLLSILNENKAFTHRRDILASNTISKKYQRLLTHWHTNISKENKSLKSIAQTIDSVLEIENGE